MNPSDDATPQLRSSRKASTPRKNDVRQFAADLALGMREQAIASSEAIDALRLRSDLAAKLQPPDLKGFLSALDVGKIDSPLTRFAELTRQDDFKDRLAAAIIPAMPPPIQFPDIPPVRNPVWESNEILTRMAELQREQTDSIVRQEQRAVAQTDSIVRQEQLAAAQTESIVRQEQLAIAQTDSILRQEQRAVAQTDSILRQEELSVDQAESTARQEQVQANEVTLATCPG